MGGAQTADTKPVAYMEPMPALGETGKLLPFDAAGTYQYASVAQRSYVPDAKLQYKWDFGDGSAPAFGRLVKHAFRTAATYTVTLRVTNRETGESDKATRRVTITQGDGNEADPAGQSRDVGSVVACQSSAGFTRASVKPSGRGLAFSGRTRTGSSFAATVYRAAKGRKATKLRKVASFAVNGSRKWRPGKLGRGVYVAQLTARGRKARPDERGFAFRRKGSRFVKLKPFQRPDSCGLISYLRLSSPVFGGRFPLILNVATTRSARVTVKLSRKGGRKTLKTSANRLGRVTFKPRKRGTYKVTVKAWAGKATARGKLCAVRL
jgi:PKD repeat protein